MSKDNNDDAEEVIDLTDETDNRELSSARFREAPYDPRPREDSARLAIAISLIALLAIIIIW